MPGYPGTVRAPLPGSNMWIKAPWQGQSPTRSLSGLVMDLVSPFAAAVAVATTAVSMGLTLLRLCKDCARAEK